MTCLNQLNVSSFVFLTKFDFDHGSKSKSHNPKLTAWMSFSKTFRTEIRDIPSLRLNFFTFIRVFISQPIGFTTLMKSGTKPVIICVRFAWQTSVKFSNFTAPLPNLSPLLYLPALLSGCKSHALAFDKLLTNRDGEEGNDNCSLSFPF